VGLSPCIVPSAGKPSFELGVILFFFFFFFFLLTIYFIRLLIYPFFKTNEIELGLGIHGEPGVKRMPLKSANELVEQIIDLILQKSPPFLASPPPSHLVLLINNLGGTTGMEISIASKHAVIYLGMHVFFCLFFLSMLFNKTPRKEGIPS
jgi:dihydroxyacetone kinase